MLSIKTLISTGFGHQFRLLGLQYLGARVAYKASPFDRAHATRWHN